MNICREKYGEEFSPFELRNVRSSKGIPCSPNVRIDHCFQSNLYQPPPSTVKASSETLDILLQPSNVYIDDKHILVFIDKVKRVDVKKKKKQAASPVNGNEWKQDSCHPQVGRWVTVPVLEKGGGLFFKMERDCMSKTRTFQHEGSATAGGIAFHASGDSDEGWCSIWCYGPFSCIQET
ncbi:hypothetical protein M413DRAFT_259591 [Hebeloma cylindrosporum]|uniref:Uncharacterized protein n=1 Tax=Hebeloma cylindrosporum TaxID=76867 RepID=A0A0C3CRB6_HEBCY|nr:hypothetical protein M413DRAFT_259591 [Hebeloma cylindrosporum h7]